VYFGLPEALLKDFTTLMPIQGRPFSDVGTYMPLSREPLRDDQLIDHLLGTLPEDEAQRVEEESIVDDEVAARLQVAEDDLVDQYARGTLAGDRLARFESFYLASPLRRDKVTVARRFVAAVDRAAPAEQETAATAAEWRGAGAWFPWSLAAAAALLLATGLLLARDVGLRRDMADARERLAAAEHRVNAVTGQLADEQRAAAAARLALENARAAQPLAAVALMLMPQTRGIDPVPVVALPAAAKTLPLQLSVPATGNAHYTAALRDPSTNGIVWRSPAVPAERGRRSSVVPVQIPASLLKAQHYALDLFEVRAGAPEFVGSYAFEIARP